MGRIWLAGILMMLFSGAAAAAESRLEKFENMTAEAQEKEIAKKVKEVGGYFQAKVGRYVVSSNISASSAYNWGLVLAEFTDEALDEGIFPKDFKKKTPNPPSVFILKDKESYAAELMKRKIDAPGWSGGLFSTRGPVLLAWKYSDQEAKMRSTVIHEATHQLMYYHVNQRAPTWFNEGFATNLENYDTARRMKANLYHIIYVSRYGQEVLKLDAAKKIVPYSRLRNVSNAQWNAAADPTANYASAWLTVNYFFTTKSGRKTVGKYINFLLKGGTEPAVNADEVDEKIKEHIANYIAPCVKYGRKILAMLDQESIDEAKGLLAKMEGEFPENPETAVYRAWVDIAGGGDAAAAIAALEKLLKDNQDFYHPCHNYVLALGYSKTKNLNKANEYLAKALKDNRKHAPTLKLRDTLKAAAK